MKQLKYVTKRLQDLKETLDNNIVTPAVATTIS